MLFPGLEDKLIKALPMGNNSKRLNQWCRSRKHSHQVIASHRHLLSPDKAILTYEFYAP